MISVAYGTDLAAQDSLRYSVRGGPIWLDADNVKGDELIFGEIQLPGSSLGVEDETHYGLILSWEFIPHFPWKRQYQRRSIWILRLVEVCWGTGFVPVK